MANVQDAINHAQEAAAQMAAQAPQPGTQLEASVSPSGTVTTFSKPSMATVAAATGVIPRNVPYVKVNEDGIKFGKDKTYFTEFKGKVKMVEDKGFQVKMTVRFGNPAQYLSTYDGAVCDKGGSWGDAMAKARMVDPNAEPYPAADILIELTEDVNLKDEVMKAGSLVGLNTSKSNFSEWQDFYVVVADAGLLDQEVDIQFGHREIEHNGNNWGVVTFELL